MKSKLKITLMFFVLILLILACGESSNKRLVETAVAEAGASANEVGNNLGDSLSVDENDTVESTLIPKPTELPIEGLVKVGTHLVNSEIQPGIYWGLAGDGFSDSCYWERLSGLTGDFDSILANDNANGSFYIEVLASDVALTTKCELIILENAPKQEYGEIFTPGIYLVGRDIEPGIYWGLAGEEFGDSCYWERMSSLLGDFDSIYANDNATGSFYIEVLDNDFALKSGCSITSLVNAPNQDLGNTIPIGTYLVGRDIEPGLYKGQAGEDFGDSCYWERLSSVSGEFDSILANENANGSFYIEVQVSDFALKTNCPLEKN